MSRPTREEIESQNRYLLLQWKQFRRTGEVVAEHLAKLPHVRRVVMFGPAAEPLKKEVPSFREFRRYGIEVWNEVSCVCFAVWLSPVDRLAELKRARLDAMKWLAENERITFAHHQVRMRLCDAQTGHYVGWLCDYGSCPKGKDDCRVLGCGKVKFAKVFRDDDKFDVNQLSPERPVPLLIRSDPRVPVTIRVREMQQTDHTHALAISRSLPEWFDERARGMAIAVDILHQRGIVGLLDGQVAGFATWYVAEGRLNIGWLAVSPEYHRKGVGRAMIERLAEIASTIGLEELVTWTLGDGVDYAPYESTRRFYVANGFQIYQRDKTDNPGCPEVIHISRKVVPLIRKDR